MRVRRGRRRDRVNALVGAGGERGADRRGTCATGGAADRQGENPTSMIPAQSDAALSQAMALEGVPESWQSSLRFIMAQESGGRVDVKNPVHSARGCSS